jgi:hypothetical protein
MLRYIALSGLFNISTQEKRFLLNLKALKGRCMSAWGEALWDMEYGMNKTIHSAV